MFHVWWPSLAVLALGVIFIVLLVLRFADKWCGARHETFDDGPEDDPNEGVEMVTYDHSVTTEREFAV